MAKLRNYIPEEEIGVYSASFGRKDVRKYNFATIQSIYKKPEAFDHIGLVIVDECDLVNPRNSKGMFTSFLKAIGNPVTVGLTATPFRNVTGVTSVDGIVTHGTMLKLINRMNPRMWNRIAFAMNHHELVERGYLVPLRYISRSNIDHNRIPLNKSRSDFDLEAFERMLEPQEQTIMESINGARKHRNSVLVFCSSVEQAERMAQVIKGGACVSGNTPLKERDRIIEGFKSGEIDVVFNVGVLTVGFDHPKLDCIYMLRPTRSLRLYIQMLGRGTRLAEGKEDCIVIDYSGNFESLGRLENVKLVKEKLWELYANGIPMHNRELFSWSK
jgi:DNA repair protein RadD